MRVKREQSDTYNVSQLYQEINILEPLFSNIMLVNPIEQQKIIVHNYGLADSNEKCNISCPLATDICGCICKDSVSNNENRVRYIYNNKEAFMVISKPIKMMYRNYTLVLIMKLNPAFQFGGHTEAKAIEEITKLSSNLVIDPLTKIFNRKYLYDNIGYMMKNAAQQRKSVCLACIDVDNFKQFNDNYGHEFGDKVLQSIANLMSKAIDVLEDAYPIRIGGDEFVIIAINIDKNRFKAIMNKLCLMVADFKLQFNREYVGICISIGVSEMMSDKADSFKELYDTADKHLYLAKEAGKGCVR